MDVLASYTFVFVRKGKKAFSFLQYANAETLTKGVRARRLLSHQNRLGLTVIDI
jgi:hypothetical protein